MSATVVPRFPILGTLAEWCWARVVEERVEGETPAGVVLNHGNHTMVVSWVPVRLMSGELSVPLTLDSLLPLTVVEPVTCSICGVTGRIEQGRWVPAKVEG